MVVDVFKFDKKSILIFENILNEKVLKNEIFMWKILVDFGRKKNFYFILNSELESELESDTVDYNFVIYKKFENGLGESSFSISISDDVEYFKKQLEEAIFISNNSISKNYSLPSYNSKFVEDSHIDYAKFVKEDFISCFISQKNFCLKKFIFEKLSILNEEISKITKYDVKLNYLEFFNGLGYNYLKISNGIEKNSYSYSFYLEFTLTAKHFDADLEFEHIVYQNINDIFKFDFRSFFRQSILFAIDSLIAGEILPFKKFEGKVILSDFAAIDFFMSNPLSPIINFALAKMKYNCISFYELEKLILNSNLDKLSISVDALDFNNIGFKLYDLDGICGTNLEFIKNSVLKKFLSSKKYSDYLNISPTGPLGVVKIKGGSFTESDFRYCVKEDLMVQIISFAWFSPDSSTGDFSAEIRLGYYFKNGVKIPFRGGLFVGNVFKILENVRLSKEKVEVPGYLGPKFLFFFNGSIVGF